MQKLIYIIFLFILFSSCTRVQRDIEIDSSFTEIHYKENHSLSKCDISEWVEKFELVKLDNTDGSLVPPSIVNISEHYIGVRSRIEEPYKLFNKQGQYICQVGAKGQGSGEYDYLCWSTICEEENCIYLLPYNATKIMAFDFSGKYLPKKSIPLAYMPPKSNFRINHEEKQVYIANISFNSTDLPCFWIQDYEGNIISEIKSASYQVTPDYAAEIITTGYTSGVLAIHYSEFNKKKQDTLFYYNKKENDLTPKFSICDPLGKEEGRGFLYMDLPKYYLTDVETLKIGVRRGTSVVNESFILVDKNTLDTKYCYLSCGFIGGLVVDVQNSLFWISDDYLTMMFEPGALLDMFEERKKQSDVTEADSRTIEKLENQLSENDNCVVVYGKLKTK